MGLYKGYSPDINLEFDANISASVGFSGAGNIIIIIDFWTVILRIEIDKAETQPQFMVDFGMIWYMVYGTYTTTTITITH